MYSDEDTEDDSYYSDDDKENTPGYPLGAFALLGVLGGVLGGVLAGGLFYRSIVKK
jgi:hypothetical protein